MKHCCQDNREVYREGRLWRCTICGCGGFTKAGYASMKTGTLKVLVRRSKLIELTNK